MSNQTASSKVAAWGLLGALFATLVGGASALAKPVSAIAFDSDQASYSRAAQQGGAIELAQVPNTDLACFLHSPDGHQFDLSALCGGFDTAASEVVLQTGDVQVTLRWNTADDLDLYVRGPLGEEVSFFNPAIASGGQLDVDANAGCAERMASPVENIFWPTGGGVPGDYVVSVDLFSYCGDEVPIDFTLTTLIKGETQTQTGTVSSDQTSVSFPFNFPAADESAGAADAAGDLPGGAALPDLPVPSAG